MIDLGVVRPGSTVRIPFSTYKGSDGSSLTMTNFAAADILVYKDGSTTERASTSGYTATTDFDSKTGDHIAIIDLADNTTAGFYAAGSEYLVAIDAVTVDGVTTGGWIGRFRIGQRAAIFDTTIATLSSQTSFTLTSGPAEDDAINGMVVLFHDVASAVQMGWGIVLDYTGTTKTVTLVAAPTFTIATTDNVSVMWPAPLQPTVSGRTLDVSTGGEAGVDLANVGSPTTTLNLSGTTISTSQVVASVSGAVGSVTGNVGGNVTGSVGSISGVSFPANFSTLGINASGHVSRVTLCDTTTTNTDMLTAAGVRTAVGLAAANLDTQLTAIDDYLDTEVAAIKAVTDQMAFGTANRLNVQVYGMEAGVLTAAAVATGAIDADALASDAVTEIANGLLDLADGVETGLTVRGSHRLTTAALCGKASGMATTTAVFRNVGDTKARITATVDADGNRSAVTTDAT